MKEWKVIYDCDTGGFIDGFFADSFEKAKEGVLDILTEWLVQEMAEWESDIPTDEELERFNMMICNDFAWVEHFNGNEYKEYWYPSYKELESIGWVERKE